MKKITEEKLLKAYNECKNKSIEYTIQFMQDSVNVSHECVMNYLYKTRNKKLPRE